LGHRTEGTVYDGCRGPGSLGVIAHDPTDIEGVQLATKAFERLEREERWGIEKLFIFH
jgi:hypothetical protein